LALTMCLIILINLKFTGLAYALVMGVGFSALFIFLREQLIGIRVMHAFFLGIFLGTFFVGYNPYVINTLSYANPFYPVLSHDMIKGNRPDGFNELNRFARFGKSVFSTSHLRAPAKRDSVKLKMPFTFTLEEIIACQNSDLRTGGFGPLFGGVFLLAIVALPLCFAYGLVGTLEATAVILIILLSAFSTAESWWARYAPQIWLVPVISIILMLYSDKHLMSRILGWFLCIILFINILLIVTIYYNFNVNNTIMVHQILTRLANAPSPVHVYFEWPSAKIKFRNLGIRYKEVASPEELGCSKPDTIPFINAKVCQESLYTK
jgi:hypothetical protein